ncbi:MAG TPA: DUF2950 domain-containing protein [Verrucomicrobiae bacterium]
MKTTLALLLTSCLIPSLLQAAASEQNFNSSEDAVSALRTAAENKDTNALETIFGPSLRLLQSPDPVQSSNGLVTFSRRMSEKVSPVTKSDSKIELNIGSDGWPFPIPLVKEDGQWHFDTEAGEEEILNRRVGRDELATIRVCHAYVEAQREYASVDRGNDGIIQYAQHLRSTQGTHDGLYWHVENGEEMSPLGPLVAQAHGEGYHHETKIMNDNEAPYYGYYFKVLTRQGAHAPGGKYNYIINGHMVAGFALVAWPAEWGNSGVMTFIVNQEGKICEANLGEKTAAIASRMEAYDPEGSKWKVVGE